MKKFFGIVFLFIATASVLVACVNVEDALDDAQADLIANYADTLADATYEVTEDLNLVTTISGADIAWSSSNEAVISNSGVVTRQETDTDVTLTATITIDETTRGVDFDVVVLAIEVVEPEVDYEYGVFNGSFESNMQSWEYYTVSGFHDILTTDVLSGEKSLRIQDITDNPYTSIWQTIDLGQEDGPMASDFVMFEANFKALEGVSGQVQLFVENVVDASTKVTIGQSEKITLTEGEWVKVETSVGEIPSGATEINIVMIFETVGEVFVDDIKLNESISNNTNATAVYADEALITGFQSNILEYTMYIPSTDVPVISADVEKDSSSVAVTQATTVDDAATVVVTAADGSTKTYTVNFVVANPTDLSDLLVNGETISGFDSSDLEYYVLLDDDTLPVVTYNTFFEETTVVMSTLETVPGVLSISVSNGDDTTIYEITFAVANENAYTIPNFGFESTFDWQTWSATSMTPSASSEEVHSGLYALLTYHQSSVWKEYEFSTGMPQINDAVKIGAWVYIDSDAPSYSFVIKVVGYTESTGSKVTFVETQITEGIALNSWVYIESDVSDVLTSDRFQVVIENNSEANIYVDDITIIEGVSSNAALEAIRIDSVALAAFDKDVLSYTFLTDGVNVPVVAADSLNDNAVVEITQAQDVNGQATIVVTAVDGSMLTYVIDFTEPSSGLLASIELDGVVLADFDAVKNTYYYMLDETTSVFPTVTATAVDNSDTVEITQGTLPGFATVVVTTATNEVNEYTIYAEVDNANALSTPYPDVNFDKNLENFGVSSTTDVYQSSEVYLNGSKSLKMVGGEAWVGFDLAGGDYPSKGSAYSIGMWLYVGDNPSGSFIIRLLEKDNNVELVNEVVTITEINKWVYVETAVSADVSDAAGYLQIVITNATGVTTYVDAIRFISQDSVDVVEPTEDTPYAMTGKNLDFESSDLWGFWSPDGTGVSYSDTANNGLQSLMMSEGSAWVGFGFDGADYPAKGDTVKLGFWVYVDSSTASSVGGLTIKLLEKEGSEGDVVAIQYTTQDQAFAFDTWVYVETQSVVISDAGAYLQIVIEEGTDGTVYVDDITVIEVIE
jgi:hypothetical protein